MTRKCFRKLTLLALICALMLGVSAWAEGNAFDWFTAEFDEPQRSLPDGAPTIAPPDRGEPASAFPKSDLKDDGWLRVYLRSLNAPKQLHLTLSGVYAVEGNKGFRFDEGTPVTLTASEGNIWLSVGGLNLDMGVALTLTRHAGAASDDENGLYIEESERNTLYCGDLSVSVTDQGGLRAVLKIRVEDYLRGVIAYEMSDSFPIEALKAQAVAARTYALQRKWRAIKRDYDVVDTTADQVFKGYDPQYINVIEAVEATRGIVGTWNGAFATCYYTASNGGQTALPSQVWGANVIDDYLDMRDDPYDVENPRSLQNELTITPTCEGSQALKTMLTEALAEVMTAQGFPEGTWDWDSIAAIEPVEPRFEGSHMYDKLAFDLKVRVAESELRTPSPAPVPTATSKPWSFLDLFMPSPAETPFYAQPAPEPERWITLEDTRRVLLDVYDDIKDGLSLGLNSGDYELVSVETTEGSGGAQTFTIIFRRFGHGVGMSQRGAQYMAGHYDKTWAQILAFYYPGMTLERIDWPEMSLTDLGELTGSVGAARPMPTPTPTPAPLPALEAGERYARVNATSLNVRERPTTASRIVDALESGQRLIVSGEMDAEGWVPIRTSDVTGYVKAEYLTD